MDKLFLDANVLFTATYSTKGASYFIFELAKSRKIKIFSSEYALEEARDNIIAKIGIQHLPVFYKLVGNLSKIDKRIAPNSEIQKFSDLIVFKDIPILISASILKVDHLITLDRKDFQTEKIKKANLPFKILLPGEYLHSLTA